MKLLNGQELAGYIKERQAKQVRGLRQAGGVVPRLAIVVTVDVPAIETYVRMKRRYGQDVLIEVDVYRQAIETVPELIKKLNRDSSVHGIIVQLPLSDVSQTDDICNLVAPEKDVDALGQDAIFDPATPMAIMWLLTGYNVELSGKHIVLVGRGKLVGKPLEKLLKSQELDVDVLDSGTEANEARIAQADVLITATGQPGLITSNMIKTGAVVVDAGVAGESGKTVGDLAVDVYERNDLTITPIKGGVGPLTICALFDNVIRAARRSLEN